MTPNPTVPYLFDFGTGNSVKLDLSLPNAEVTAHELLPAVFSVADEVVRHSCSALEEMGKPIQCGPGCGACCKQLVPVSEYEAVHLASVVRAMPSVQRSRIVGKFSEAIAKLDKAELLSELTNAYANEVHDWRKLLPLKKKYWNLAIPCPFLEENSCSIHPHRPIACRQYLVTSDRAHCADIYSEDEEHEVVLHPVDVGGAMASFSGEGLQHSRVMPHIFSLLAERGIRSHSVSVLPADQMMGRFLDLLTTCFSRSS